MPKILSGKPFVYNAITNILTKVSYYGLLYKRTGSYRISLH